MVWANGNLFLLQESYTWRQNSVGESECSFGHLTIKCAKAKINYFTVCTNSQLACGFGKDERN